MEFKKIEGTDDLYYCENNTYRITRILPMEEWEKEQQGGKYKPYKSTRTDYSSNGPVFKDETTKDLLEQLKDAKSAFYLLVGMFILSFMLNIAFAWSIWNSSSDTVYPLSPKEIQKRIKAHSFVGASDTLYINSKK